MPTDPKTLFEAGLSERLYAASANAVHQPRAEHEQLLTWLEGQSRKRHQARKLERKITSCRKRNRCLSGACPLCIGAAREFVVQLGQQTAEFILRDHKECVFATIIDVNSTKQPDCLHELSIPNHHRRLKALLKKTAANTGIFVVDYTFNIDRDNSYDPHFVAHSHGLVGTADLDDLRRTLRKHVKGSECVQRPVHVKAWDGSDELFRYFMKSSFSRRETYCCQGSDAQENSGRRAPHRNTKQDRLRSHERLELLTHLDANGIGSRLTFIGTQLRRALNKGISLSQIQKRA